SAAANQRRLPEVRADLASGTAVATPGGLPRRGGSAGGGGSAAGVAPPGAALPASGRRVGVSGRLPRALPRPRRVAQRGLQQGPLPYPSGCGRFGGDGVTSS